MNSLPHLFRGRFASCRPAGVRAVAWQQAKMKEMLSSPPVPSPPLSQPLSLQGRRSALLQLSRRYLSHVDATASSTAPHEPRQTCSCIEQFTPERNEKILDIRRADPASVGGDVKAVEDVAQHYYDDPNAVNFHRQVWGDTIHIGRYDLLRGQDANLEGKARIWRAGELATEVLLSRAFSVDGLAPGDRTIMDMGSSKGDLARKAVETYGCTVVCIDLSRAFNRVNAERSAAAGMSDKIIIPGERSYFNTMIPASSIDVVVSQDSFGHASTEHHRAIMEAARVLKPGGTLTFSELMRSDTADPAKLAEVFKQQKIAGLASPESYKSWGEEYGLEFVSFDEQTSNFALQYSSILGVIDSIEDRIEGVDPQFLEWMKVRYGAWVIAATDNLLSCGVMFFTKRQV